ncbi:MAG TPA: hypothetical protein VNT22_09820 [Baekduia sp.]|nr:hypothetical protein [Baekduia sp.]
MLIAATVAAFVAGLTGSWSPCGLSMISTLSRSGHGGGLLTTLAACVAFVPGALVGGVFTFGMLAIVGQTLGGGELVLAVAVMVLLLAAALEIRGTPIVPQIRRQVPEHWRRLVPLPHVAAAYGVLLGLGFTTFVLTFAVPALAAIALLIGDPVTGLAIGLAFGAGRALPVVVLAPLAERSIGVRARELMEERPGVLRSFRFADGLALLVCAAAVGVQSAELAAIIVP